MRALGWVKRLVQNWVAHDDSRSAAAIAFYAIFTVAPMLVFATAGLGMVVGRQKAESLTVERLTESLGPTGGYVAHEVLTNANFNRHSILATVVSGLILLFAASSMFLELRYTLDRIFGRAVKTTHEEIIAWALGRLIAALSVVVGVTLFVATLVAQVIVTDLSAEVIARLDVPSWVWRFTSTTFTVAIVAVVVIGLFKFLPSQPPAWRHVLLGAAVSVALLELGKWAIGLYISRSVIASAYGPSSAIVAFILWVYYSSQILILGAEVCQLSVEDTQRRADAGTGQ